MPIIKASEPLGPRPVIIAWYGDPGIGKTSLFNTCTMPLLIDGDRGVSRSILRKDTLIPDSWDEVLQYEKEGAFKGYSTIGIDTPKAILDDFLMSYVIRIDPKLQRNKLGAYGEIGNEFKLFTGNRRQDKADLAIICHARKDEDSKRMIPDVTGQSLNLILRIADMIGYYTVVNGRRMLFFEPTETTFGKNVACLPPIEVPDKTDPAFKTFMADIFEKVRAAIASQSEEQVEAMNKSAQYQQDIAECDSPDRLTEIIAEVNGLPDYLKVPLRKLISEKAKEKGYTTNLETKRFELPTGAQVGSDAGKPADPAATKQPEGVGTLDTSFDDRCVALATAGLAMEMEQATGFGLTFTYDEIADWTEDQYMDAVVKVNEAKKAKKPNRTRPSSVAR